MLVKPKQSQSGVMWVARLMCTAFPGAKVDRVRLPDGAGFLEGMKVPGVDLQAAGRRHLQAAPAVVALFGVQVEQLGGLLVLHQGGVRAGGDDALARLRVRAQLGEPVGIELHGVVHGAARLAGHAAQRQVLESRPKAAARVTLDVRQVDQEGGVLDQSGDLPVLDVLERAVVA